MFAKLKNILTGKTGKWNRTNNIVVSEMYKKFGNYDFITKEILKHLLISTDILACDVFGVKNQTEIFELSKKDVTHFKKFYSAIISFYGYNIALNNKNISQDILNAIKDFCLDSETSKETIKIFDKYPKSERTDLSKVGWKIIGQLSYIMNENLNIEKEFILLSKLILFYNFALESIHKSLNKFDVSNIESCN